MANEAALTPEEAQGVSTATEYIQALRSSLNPLPQLLATIEDSDVVLCALGQLLEEKQKCFLEMIAILADSVHPLAGTLVHLLEPMTYSCFPTLIGNMHNAHHVLTHAHMQVQAYPDLVDCQAVPHNEVVDFRVRDPPVNSKLQDEHGNQCGHN